MLSLPSGEIRAFLCRIEADQVRWPFIHVRHPFGSRARVGACHLSPRHRRARHYTVNPSNDSYTTVSIRATSPSFSWANTPSPLAAESSCLQADGPDEVFREPVRQLNHVHDAADRLVVAAQEAEFPRHTPSSFLFSSCNCDLRRRPGEVLTSRRRQQEIQPDYQALWGAAGRNTSTVPPDQVRPPQKRVHLAEWTCS